MFGPEQNNVGLMTDSVARFSATGYRVINVWTGTTVVSHVCPLFSEFFLLIEMQK